MPTVQELLTALRQHTEEAPSAEQLRAVAQAVSELDTMLIAWFPATRHWFITVEQNEPTAVVFSNRDSFEAFAARCKEQGIYVEAMENAKADRPALFMDLVRCGFTQVLIDYAPAFLVLPVTAFVKLPDFTELSLVERPFPAPFLTGKILYLFQQIHAKKADGELELAVLRELYHSPLFMPVQVFEADGQTAYHVPAEEQDGKRTAHLFTDRVEWERFGVSPEYAPAVARFAELQTLLQGGFDRLVINPGSGAELVLDASLLDAAEQAVMGDVRELDLRTLQTQGEKLTVSDPEEVPDKLTVALISVLEQHDMVNAAYLRVLKRSNVLHPSWLVLLDLREDRGRKTLHRELSTAAQPYLGSFDIEFAAYDEAEDFAGKTKPFYKKRRGLFR